MQPNWHLWDEALHHDYDRNRVGVLADAMTDSGHELASAVRWCYENDKWPLYDKNNYYTVLKWWWYRPHRYAPNTSVLLSKHSFLTDDQFVRVTGTDRDRPWTVHGSRTLVEAVYIVLNLFSNEGADGQ